MPRRGLPALALVAVLASGCTSTGPSAVPATPPASPVATLPSAVAPTPPSSGLPARHTVSGGTADAAFDLATDGWSIVWSDGAIDLDAPDLWRLDVATGRTDRRYRSADPGAVLGGIAVRSGRIAFSEVTGRDRASTWRLVLLDAAGTAHVLDTDDHAEGTMGLLPMAALSDVGILWATSHAGAAGTISCQLRYASFADLVTRTIAAAPCDERQFWYPSSDGATFVWSSVDDTAGTPDGTGLRRVWAATDRTLAAPRRLDVDDAAMWPVVRGGLVVWKVAPPPANIGAWTPLAAVPLAGGTPTRLGYPATPGRGASAPSLGDGFLAADTDEQGVVAVWDLGRAVVVPIDRLDPSDPGFVSNVRLAGSILAWFYTDAVAGGGTREIRWVDLTAIRG
jgi:hypothetical protein